MKWRYLIWTVLPVALLLVLMWLNPHVSNRYFVQRVMPFIAIDFAKVLMIAVMLAQHPAPEHGIPRWQFWRSVDPVVLVLIGTTLPSIIYYLMLVGGNSQWFRAPDWVYTVARVGMLVFGYIATVVWCEMMYRAIRSRLDNRRRHLERYDVRYAEGERSK